MHNFVPLAWLVGPHHFIFFKFYLDTPKNIPVPSSFPHSPYRSLAKAPRTSGERPVQLLGGAMPPDTTMRQVLGSV